MIPLFRPVLPKDEAIIRNWDMSRSCGQLTNFGPNFIRAQSRLDALYGGNWLPVSNGTSAIEIALEWLLPKCRVAVCEFTFAATALAVVRSGRTPVLFSATYNRANFNHDDLERHHRSYDAILAVAPFGYDPPAEMIGFVSKHRNKPLIWDLAGAFPMMMDQISTYSLHAAKSLPIGEGGLIRYPERSDLIKGQRMSGFDFDEEKRCLSDRGTNAKLDELRCAVLLAQLERIESIYLRLKLHKRLVDFYQHELRDYCDPVFAHKNGHPSMVVLRLKKAEKIVRAGAKEGIVCRQYYHPLLSRHPGLVKYSKLCGSPDPRMSHYLALPCDVSDEEKHRVVKLIKKVYRKK